MQAIGPDPSKWTPESRAEFCRTSGLTEGALDAYAEMHAAWRAVEFVGGRKPSAERRRMLDDAYARFRAKAARWQHFLRIRGGVR